jgi:hypothetical protein
MRESAPSPTAAAPVAPGVDPGALIAALRERGADGFDAVRFHFIETLARRAATYQGPARRLLDDKLAEALREYRERFAQAQDRAEATASPAESPPARTPLAELVGRIAPPVVADAAGTAPDQAGAAAGPRAELKSLRYFRDTWARLSVDQQLSQALAQGPKNAGPLNSHLLVLQSIQLMQDLSPDYLKRFMSYVDTLLWLEQANGGNSPAAKEMVRGEPDKKRKSARAKSG